MALANGYRDETDPDTNDGRDCCWCGTGTDPMEVCPACIEERRRDLDERHTGDEDEEDPQ